MARELRLSLVVRALDRATAPLRRIGRAVDQIGRRTGLDRVGMRLRAVGRGMRDVGAAAGRFGRRFALGMAAAGAGVGALAARFAKQGDDLAKMSDRIGIAIERLQKLQHAFDLGGIARGKSAQAMLYFTARIGEATRGTGEAADVFKAMGISILDVNGKVKTTSDLFDEVADAMERQPSIAKSAYAAQQLFGRAGRQMVKVLSQGSAAIRKQGDEMDRLGIISTAEARASEQFIDTMLRMGRAVEGVANAIGARLLPHMEPLIKRMTEFFVQIRPAAVEEFEKAMVNLDIAYRAVSGAVRDVTDGIKRFIDKMDEAFPGVRKFVDKMAGWFDEIGWVTIAFGILTALMAGGLIKAIIALVGPFAKLGAALAVVVGKIALIGGAFLLANLPIVLLVAAVAGAAYLLWRYWGDIEAAFERGWARLKRGWAKAEDGWAATMGTFRGLVLLFELYWEEIEAAFERGWAKLTGGFSRTWKAITKEWNEFKALFDFDNLVAKVDRFMARMTARLPDFILKGIGIDPGAATARAASTPPPTGGGAFDIWGGLPAPTPALAGGGRVPGGFGDEFRGEVVVRLEGARAGDRVESVRTNNPNIRTTAETGYSMAEFVGGG